MLRDSDIWISASAIFYLVYSTTNKFLSKCKHFKLLYYIWGNVFLVILYTGLFISKPMRFEKLPYSAKFKWMSEWMNERIDERTNERTNERRNKYMVLLLCHRFTEHSCMKYWRVRTCFVRPVAFFLTVPKPLQKNKTKQKKTKQSFIQWRLLKDLCDSRTYEVFSGKIRAIQVFNETKVCRTVHYNYIPRHIQSSSHCFIF